MQKHILLCYITDRAAFGGDEAARRVALVDKIGEAARAGVDFVQLREKDLSGRELERLALAAAEAIRRNSAAGTAFRTKLLVNARVDVALAVEADGVHLPAGDLSPDEVRGVWARGERAAPVISVSCHTVAEVRTAAEAEVDFALFAPVFGKKDALTVAAAGVEGLREACRVPVPVVALGGVSLGNAGACLEAGAAGVAAIRMFQEQNISRVVCELREDRR
jgi:thiamine-phosphate pyrophosphorylase